LNNKKYMMMSYYPVLSKTVHFCLVGVVVFFRIIFFVSYIGDVNLKNSLIIINEKT